MMDDNSTSLIGILSYSSYIDGNSHHATLSRYILYPTVFKLDDAFIQLAFVSYLVQVSYYLLQYS